MRRSRKALAGAAIACVVLAAMTARAWPSVKLNRALLTCVRPGEPKAQCESALDLDNPRALYYAGVVAWHSGDPVRAARQLSSTATQYPDNPAAALMLGQAMLANGDRAGAVALWRRIGAFPYFLQRARSLSSLEDAAIAVELDPASAQAHEARGHLLEAKRRVAEAAASYRQAQAVVRPGEESLALLLKGHELRLLGDAGDVEAYQQAADAAPGAVAPLYALADAALRQKDFQRAESAYRRVLQILPDELFARVALAEVWLNAGDHARASELFETIAAQVPASGRAPAFLGYIALQRGDLPGARRRLEEAVTREPQLAWAYEWLGDARRAQGDTAGAAQAYREAVRLDPGLATAAEQLRLLEKP